MKTLLILIVAPLAVVIAFGSFMSWATCASRWSGSGMQTSWGPLQGCKVRLPDGRWMPENRVREFDTQPKASSK